MARKPRGFFDVRGADAVKLARPEVLELVPYRGGKSLDETRLETGRTKFVKLASNENSLGPSPKALAAMRSAILESHLYPDARYPLLKEAIGKHFDLASKNVVLGNGSNEIIVLACNAFLRRGDEAVFGAPSFVVFRHAIIGAGGRPVAVPLRELRHDLAAMAKAVTKRTRLIFVCNPNNPTGTIVGRREVEDFLRRLPAHVIVVFDEAYAEFVSDRTYPDSLSYVRRDCMVLAIRTFAKLYGLAGLRIGYGLGTPELVSVLERLRQPYNVNAIAYRAAIGAISDRRHVARTLKCVREGRQWLCRELERMGLDPVPSQANFVLVRTGIDGARVAEGLLRRGVIVRPMPGDLLRRFVRITVGSHSENRVAMKELSYFLREDGRL